MEMAHIPSIKSINMSGSGKKIVFGGRVSYIGIRKYFLKEFSRRGLNMARGNISMTMEMYSRVIISKIKRGAKVVIILAREESWNLNLIPALHKSQRFFLQMAQFM